MTHDPREAEAFNRRFMEPFCNKHECRPCKECGTATDFIHQQLQKTRQDWLREATNEIDDMFMCNFEIYKRNKSVGEIHDDVIKALQTIIDRYQSELDQDKK